MQGIARVAGAVIVMKFLSEGFTSHARNPAVGRAEFGSYGTGDGEGVGTGEEEELLPSGLIPCGATGCGAMLDPCAQPDETISAAGVAVTRSLTMFFIISRASLLRRE